MKQNENRSWWEYYEQPLIGVLVGSVILAGVINVPSGWSRVGFAIGIVVVVYPLLRYFRGVEHRLSDQLNQISAKLETLSKAETSNTFSTHEIRDKGN